MPAAASTKPEVLAPAGNWECARAAVENGADAIYFGAGRFNARVRADNFTLEDLPELMAFLHRRGVRGYLTFNTLIFTGELDEAARALRRIIAAGVDAAIVQDVGVCRLIRRISPDFPIHASTQMTLTSDAGIAFAHDLGASLAVLSRECSVAELAAIREKLDGTDAAMPLEVFVHGALCVAYSGQCLTSEALGGRSANRGECAQACRLPYELIADGKSVPLGDRKYLLSPQDLAGIEALPELMRAGIASLKIEGRLKAPEYVAAITRAYRRAVDALAGQQDAIGAVATAASLRRELAYELEMSFSRGLGTGWLHGIDNRKLVHARFGKKRGVFLGTIAHVAPEYATVALRPADATPLKAGDGVVFDDGKPESDESGGFIHAVDAQRDGTVRLRFSRESFDWRRVRTGQRLWKTADPAFTRAVRATYAAGKIHYRRPVNIHAIGAVGQPLRVTLDDGEGHAVTGASALPLAAAAAGQKPLDHTFLAEQLGRLGGTPFSAGEITVEVDGTATASPGELNRLRRELVERLDALRAVPRRWTLFPEGTITRTATAPTSTAPTAPELIPVVRNMHQLEAAIQWGARTIYCEFEDLRKNRDATARAREFAAANGTDAAEIWVLPPRIFKQGEERFLEQVRDCDATGYLVRNHEHLRCFAGARLRGDFSLNIANPLAAEYFFERHRLERLTASYDLDAAQLRALLQAAPAHRFDITLHQHMPMFHMEHCVFCAFLSTGKDFRDCGRPCEKHTVQLRDRVGMSHPVVADAGCRNTVYNGRAQTGAEYFGELLAAGARHFRIEFVDESRDAVSQTLERYAELLRGATDGASLWRSLKLHSQLGVTRGTLASPSKTGL